ncbi:two component transcriptional regulator, winged helix family [Thermodesulfobacterium geofontis OPF15]|uniref:Two component transcriptional regulator, winged helix family n=1 Tax=Thermodesulfobacterium geofontis (strain OPF15) TaxID=795359 RepID=F8C422_THEGP|nr:response regulator transcription factor [Thermodesulfobacterium geofontis]AEH22561.1 two component transcriptional regulator, winged helix family [Thermodesulfobacterium geofontis OPF15]
MEKILIVEDDKEIGKILSEGFSSQGYKCHIVSSLSEAYIYLLSSSDLSLVILDLILPDGDGLELLKYLRSTLKFKKLPVIIISARGAELDRILGLELGADDYVVKPFSLREVIIRANKILKRNLQPEEILNYGPLKVDKKKKIILLEEKLLTLTPTEYKILETLVENSERIITREELIRIIWPVEKEYYSRVLDAYICRLRTKLGKYGKIIETVRGFGYRLAQI